MLKKLLTCLLIVGPLLSYAQTEAGLKKDFAKDVHGMVNPLKLNDKIYITAVNAEKNQINVAAINADMEETWETPLEGFAFSVSKFKGKILVVTSTEHERQPTEITYKGYLLDPATGKVVLEKDMLKLQLDNMIDPYFFASEDGSFYKIAIRTTEAENKKNWANLFFPVALYNMGKMASKSKETNDITITDFDEKLNPINEFHPQLSEDSFITMVCNNWGDIFVSWYSQGIVTIEKYANGQKKRASQVTEEFDMRKKTGAYFTFFPSKKTQKYMYMTVVYTNLEKEEEVNVSKIDFDSKTVKPVTEQITRAKMKEAVNNFVPLSKKLDKPFEIIGNFLTVRMLTEQNDRVIVFLAAAAITTYRSSSGQYVVIASEGSMLIKGYDLDLNPKYDQLFPSGYKINTEYLLHPGINRSGNNLNIVADFKKDGTLSGVMDIATGEWKDMDLLPKKKLGGGDFPQGSNIMWFPEGYIVPFSHQKGFTRINMDIALQQITY